MQRDNTTILFYNLSIMRWDGKNNENLHLILHLMLAGPRAGKGGERNGPFGSCVLYALSTYSLMCGLLN